MRLADALVKLSAASYCRLRLLSYKNVKTFIVDVVISIKSVCT